jgi:hypothetical protein
VLDKDFVSEYERQILQDPNKTGVIDHWALPGVEKKIPKPELSRRRTTIHGIN